jgi:hypothetical protein
VNRIDWDTMLAGLEQQRTGLEQELADVDAVIDAVRRRSAPKVRIADVSKGTLPARKAAKNGKRDGRSTLTDAQLKAMREQFERGDSAEAIGKKFGVTDSAVYLRAKKGGWKRPNPGAAASPAAAAPTERMAEKLAGRVRCTSCDLWTEYDPCENCGKKLKRNW